MENHLKIEEAVLKIQTLVAEKKDCTAIKKDSRQGVLQATFSIDDVPNAIGSSLCSEKTDCAGASWWLDVRKTKKG
uniref:Uncharacterized protein n=1 Tax=Ditylenchus dipsaci TaxID=166011 RepID=A0A915DGR3_9BILA